MSVSPASIVQNRWRFRLSEGVVLSAVETASRPSSLEVDAISGSVVFLSWLQMPFESRLVYAAEVSR